MADVTTPFGFPYPESTDLVRDGATDIEALAEGVNDALVTIQSEVDAAGNAGIGSNVVQSVLTTIFTTTSDAFQDTGLSATITPTLATSKILVLLDIKVDNNSSGRTTHVRMERNGTGIYLFTDGPAGTESTAAIQTVSSGRHGALQAGGIFVDSPATTSAVTYKAQVRASEAGNKAVVNTDGLEATNNNRGIAASSLTVIEVSA